MAEEFINIHLNGSLTGIFKEQDIEQTSSNQVLWYLHCHGNRAYPKELCGFLSTSTAHISAILNALEADGMVTRGIDPTDNRRKIVRLTPKGRDVTVRSHTTYRDRLTGLFDYLGEKDTAEFIRLYEKISTYTKTVEKPQSFSRSGRSKKGAKP